MKSSKNIIIMFLVILSLSGISSCGPSSGLGVGIHYASPPWAPPYEQGVRYYYLPDIEIYYDLSDQSFVYLDNGEWIFSHTLPPIYSNYDLYNGFVIALNFNVYEPWMHHQVYVSHYPRFYYRNVYRNDASKNIRGFNERERKPFYWKPEERNKPEGRNRYEDRNRPEDRNRDNDQNKNSVPPRRFDAPRQPQNPNYRGKEVGRPVRVRPNMRENKREENRINKNNQTPHRDLP